LYSIKRNTFIMQILDLTLPTPAENLALDEALLDEAEAAERAGEVLRVWEPSGNMVVLGRSSRVEAEVDLDFCRKNDIPILRRASGGAAILTGPGCLMYAVVLGYQQRPNLRAVGQAHSFVLGVIARAIKTFEPRVEFCGISDLALGDLKFSGNSMRCRRGHFLYHGTILYDFPLELISRCLKTPARMPEYRAGRDHNSFITNLPVTAEAIQQAIIQAWDATEPMQNWPRELTARLALEKYGNNHWNGI
jgi:lipoate-protein ligase A